jgi:GDP-mannose pyrophosphatase NudK
MQNTRKLGFGYMKSPAPRNLETKILSDQHYALKKITFELQNSEGEWVKQTRESYDIGNGAAVLLYNTEKKTVLLARQFRVPSYLNGNADGYLLEACAGNLDGDSPEIAILREAEEEMGYRLSAIEKVFELYMSPGAVTEILYLFLAEYDFDQKISAGGGLESENETIEVLEYSFLQALAMARNGKIKDAKTIVLLQSLALSGRMGVS